ATTGSPAGLPPCTSTATATAAATGSRTSGCATTCEGTVGGCDTPARPAEGTRSAGLRGDLVSGAAAHAAHEGSLCAPGRAGGSAWRLDCAVIVLIMVAVPRMPLDAARDAVIAAQARVIEVLAGQVADLAARVERLERAASRNSGNSSMPPSADDLPGRTSPKPKPGRGKGGRKPGKQPGVPGSHLAWSENPDKRVPHFPA